MNAERSSSLCSSANATSAERDSHRSRTAPPPLGGCSAQPAAPRTARTSSPRTPALPPARAAPRRRVTPSRTSARSKKRSTPRNMIGTPRSVSADSSSADCAFTRKSTAISLAEVPFSMSSAIALATEVASSTSSSYDFTTGFTPPLRTARNCKEAGVLLCAITAFAAATIGSAQR
ncbi:unannotated protein [freshwater metagenome]|uniref:Unannotated protein n=1 Tax=freshwater metagenome TaxID=449393 RepID=A0A6J6MLH5_9ZZZZ